MPLFAWNIVLVVPSGHTAQTCWKLLLTAQSTAPGGQWGVSQTQTGEGNKAFLEERCELCPGAGGMAHETRLLWRGSDARAPLWLSWVQLWHQEKSSSPRAVTTDCLHGGGPHPAGSQNPRKGVQELSPKQQIIYFKGLPKEHPPPQQPGGTACSSQGDNLQGTLLLSATRPPHLSCGKAKHRSAVESAVLMWLGGTMK